MKPVSPAAAFVALIPVLAEAAREVGYALAVHGSMARDLDLVAIPWTDEAVSAEQLIMRICAAGGVSLMDTSQKGEDGEFHTIDGSKPTVKPHGRLAWSLHNTGGRHFYLDVSVLPRAAGHPASQPAVTP